MLTLQPNRPPVLQDRYEIVGTIDQSGYLWQYLAWDAQEERWCTLRMLSFRHATDAVSRSRFEREIHCLQRVRHPNVLPVYDADPSHAVHPWAVTAVAEGGSVRDWMGENGPLPSYLAIDVMAHVCSGLAAAHKAGVSHGALKLEHMLIDRLGSCMVAGLRGGGERGDVQADVKAVGALFYTMVTGRTWDDAHALGLLTALPASVARAVEQTRKGRGGYADVSTFSRDLEAAVLDLPTPDGTVPPLAGPGVALPDDPAALWSDDSVFPDLEHLAARALDPNYEPIELPDPPTPVSDLPSTPVDKRTQRAPSAPKAPYQPKAAAPEPEASGPAIPYTMSRAATASGDSGFDGDKYQVGGKPLYEDAPKAGDQGEWQNWDPSEDMVVEKPVDEADKPLVSEALLIKLLAAAAAFFVLVVVGTIGYGASKVGEARVEGEQAAASLVEAVRGESGLVYGLGQLGADQKKLEDAYFAYSEANNDIQRVRASIVFVKAVDEEARARGVDPVSASGAASDLTQRIESLTRVHSEMQAKRSIWAQRASGFPGMLPVALGLQIAPPY